MLQLKLGEGKIYSNAGIHYDARKSPHNPNAQPTR